MNERLVLELARWTVGSGGERSRLWTGTGTQVHPSANLVGAVVLQDGARVGEGATLIGPAVIGRDAVVEARATVAQSVVGAGQVVACATTLRHRVYLGAGDPASANGGESEPLASEIWETQPLAMGSGLASRSFYPAFKRAFDATVAAVVLLLLLPLCLLLAALVKLESKGPIFFGHIREGLGGKAFRCWKFRTMFVGADQQQRKLLQLNQVDGPQVKVRRDPRRTVLGRFLTASNVDELPQLWTVLVGEMSLVGPRPSPFRENQVCVPWREGRLSVRPGISGLWQICRHDRDKGDFHQWIYYDLLYVRHMSLLLDLKIMFLTLVAFAKGGYIPLSWLLSPRQYGERRTGRRPPDEAGAADRIRAEASEAS